VFEEVLGIPAHPLIVHAAVVFVPLQILAAIVYGLLPALRPRVTWAVVSLAVIGPATAWAAKLSGQAFRDRLVRHGAHDPTFLGKIDTHMGFGTWTAWLALCLGVGTLALVLLTRRPRPSSQLDTAEIAADAASVMGRGTGAKLLALILTVVIVVVAAVTGYYVFRTGDSGAHIVWQNQ
jgi:hypothetical protein